jgi:hypothetical protein
MRFSDAGSLSAFSCCKSSGMICYPFKGCPINPFFPLREWKV